MKVVYHPDARRDLSEAARWYRRRSKALSQRFRDEYRRLLVRIKREPATFRVLNSNRRQALFDVFPFEVTSVWIDETIFVLAVIHGRRDPDVWERRLLPGEPPSKPN